MAAALNDRLILRALAATDRAAALHVINTAAQWYEEIVPEHDAHAPEMTPAQFDAEGARLRWYGAFVDDALVAVMGLESIAAVALIRHGYVLPAHQRGGVGSALLRHLEAQTAPAERIYIGTYATNYKARANLERNGYRLCEDSAAILQRYFKVPPERAASSVTYEKLRQA